MSMADRDGVIWYDGELVQWRDATTHVLTHTLHYGMGVFEGVRAYNTLDRLRFQQPQLMEYVRQGGTLVVQYNVSNGLVTQALGQVFMKRPFDDPFSAVDQVLRAHPSGGLVQAAVVDFQLARRSFASGSTSESS